MKNPKHYLSFISKSLFLLFITAIILLGCESTEADHTHATSCDKVVDIEGKYTGSGECVITDKDGKRTVSPVPSETDVIERYKDATQPLYQVKITGGSFHELEIGPLSGRVLYTATAEVSDSTYPVLEQYIFDVDESCKAVGFTKVVRNPDPKSFKACVVYCKKVEE